MDQQDRAVADLWAEVRPNLLGLAVELRAAVAAVQRDAHDRGAWSHVRSITHRLAGTLGSFGQHTAGAAALAMEELTSGVEEPDEHLLARVSSLAVAIERALEHDPR